MEEIKGSFLGFTFGGIHSYSLGIIRTSDEGNFKDNLIPNLKEKVGQVPGSEGQIYYGTDYDSKQITLSFAFSGLTEEQVHQINLLFNNKKPQELIFDECPYKVYLAKISETIILKHVVNERDGIRFYCGSGQLVFTCCIPFARSRYEYIEDYTVDNILEWAKEEDIQKIENEEYATISILPAKIEYDVNDTGEVLGAIRGDKEDFEKWLKDLSLLTPVEDNIYETDGLAQFPLQPVQAYYNISEWLESSKLPSRADYGHWSSDGYVLYNAGDVPIPFEIFFKFPSYQYITVNIRKGTKQMSLNMVSAKMKNLKADVYIGINSKDYTIRGYDKDLKFTGNTYNEYIQGDFFLLETGENVLQTSLPPATVKMHYLYI